MAYEFVHSLKKEIDERWKESQPLFQQWWYEADLDTKMVTGQQDYWNTFYNINTRNTKVLMFNKMLRVHNMIGGYQRKNRMATIVTARHNDDEQTSTDLSEAMLWAHEDDNTYEKISQCFDGSNITGLNLLNVWMDYREDPENGAIRTARIPFNAFLMDPYWTQSDLSDCDWIWTRRYLSRAQVLSLFPDLKNDLSQLSKGYSTKDGRFQFLAQNWYQYQQELYAYDEYWKRDYRPVRKVLDQSSGEVIDWNGTRDQFELFKRFNPNVKLIKAMKPTVRMHCLINSNVVYEEQQPFGIDRFPFVPFTCYHFPEVQNYSYRYMGIARNIRDSQIELNRRRNLMLDIYDSQVQSGMIVKEDALVNPEDAFLQGPGRVQFAKQTANLQADFMPIPPPNIPSSIFQLEEMLDAEIMSIAGVNEELFGEGGGKGEDPSGLLHKLRMGAALVSLQGVFDRLDQAQMQVGDIFLDLMQANFSKGKMRAILGREVSDEFEDTRFLKYRCKTEEGLLTTTQRQLEFTQAVYLKQILGDAMPNEFLVDKATIQGKAELKQMIQQREQQMMQMQQAQAQAELEQKQMQSRQLESVAQANFASADERKTRAISNIGLAKERSSQAMHDRAAAALDNAKAFKELSQLDESRLMEMARFIIELQDRQKMSAGGEEGDSAEASAADTASIDQANDESKAKQDMAMQGGGQ
jgi:hypothetical protein